MLSFAPEIVEDEMLISYVARWYHLSGFSSVDRFFRAAFGEPVKADSMNASLNLRLQWTGGFLASSEQIIRNMTFAPYARVFVGRGGLAKVFSVPPRGRRVPRRPSIFGKGPWRLSELRYCHFCCRRQELELGFSVWTRRHNLPGVSVCSEHGVQLQSIRFRRDRLEVAPSCQQEVDVKRADRDDLWFALQSEELLRQGFDLSQPFHWRDGVRTELTRYFRKSEWKERNAFVSNAFREQFSEKFLERLNLSKASDWSRSLDMLCSPAAKISNPVFAILLAKVLRPGGLLKLMDESCKGAASGTDPEQDTKIYGRFPDKSSSIRLFYRVNLVKQRSSKQLPLFN